MIHSKDAQTAKKKENYITKNLCSSGTLNEKGYQNVEEHKIEASSFTLTRT